MRQFGDVYSGKRVLVTGHTGFKGSWLALWLQNLGAEVTGLSLPPSSTPNHWDLLDININDLRGDIRDCNLVERTIKESSPDLIFHLAAQPLVRHSYQAPLETWSSNVIGTANVLDVARRCASVLGIVAVTTDKCYENFEWVWGYRENDRLGGHDPYSASKAAVELLVRSYRDSFYNCPSSPLIASARAGNVIGGGDWSVDRLVPDYFRAVQNGQNLEIRSPKATRPWQHVLESLSGYLLLGSRLLSGDRTAGCAWNFGPDSEGNRSVEEILQSLSSRWGGRGWNTGVDPQPYEAGLLRLDISKARRELKWRPIWTLDEALEHTASWYNAYLDGGKVESYAQLQSYVNDASERGASWA